MESPAHGPIKITLDSSTFYCRICVCQTSWATEPSWLYAKRIAWDVHDNFCRQNRTVIERGQGWKPLNLRSNCINFIIQFLSGNTRLVFMSTDILIFVITNRTVKTLDRKFGLRTGSTLSVLAMPTRTNPVKNYKVPICQGKFWTLKSKFIIFHHLCVRISCLVLTAVVWTKTSSRRYG